MFQRCLICTDFSDGLHRLVQFVPSLAAGGMKQIVFMHSVPLQEEGAIPRVNNQKINQIRDRLSVALQNIPEGVEVKVEVASGKPLDTIPKAVNTYHPEVILLGTSTRSLLEEKVFGSTTAGIARATKIPLMIFRPQLISTYTYEELELRCRHLYRYLLIPYNGSDAAKYVVNKVKQYTQNQPIHSLEKCMLSWVVEDSHRHGLPPESQVKQAEETLQTIKADLEQVSLQVNIDVRQGNAVSGILETVMEFDISAIAISSDKMGKFLAEWSVPSLAAEILRRSWHPVLFFPLGN